MDRPASAQPSVFALASHGMTRIKEWAARGNAKQKSFAPRSCHLVSLPRNAALQASFGGLVREGIWRIPPMGLLSPAGIRP
jgi:hypothetical protein